MIDNEVKKIDNSFCFFSIGDITTKENMLVNLLLSLFNYNYYSIDNIIDNYNTLEPLSIINKVIGCAGCLSCFVNAANHLIQ